MKQVSVLPSGSDLVSRDDLAGILLDAAVAAEAGLATLADVGDAGVFSVGESAAITGAASPSAANVFATMADIPQADNVAAIGTTTDLTAVPASFADLAAVRTYLAGAGAVPLIESRLDAIEGKADAIIAALVAAGIMAAP